MNAALTYMKEPKGIIRMHFHHQQRDANFYACYNYVLSFIATVAVSISLYDKFVFY